MMPVAAFDSRAASTLKTQPTAQATAALSTLQIKLPAYPTTTSQQKSEEDDWNINGGISEPISLCFGY